MSESSRTTTGGAAVASGDTPSRCAGLRPPFDDGCDWRSLGDGQLRCGYCPATRPENPFHSSTGSATP